MPDRSDQEAISRLLPFYLNGTLPGGERARIESALAASPELRGELEQHRKLMGLVKEGGQQWAAKADGGTPSPEPEAIRAMPAAPAQDSTPQLGSMLAFLSPANWNPAVALSLALAVGLQAGALIWQGQRIGALEQQNYELASGKDPVLGKGTIMVELKDDASWSKVVELLGNEGLTIAASGDFGTLTLKSDKQGAELAAQIERLRKSSLIASAEPAA